MGLPKAITATEQTVAVTIPVIVYSIGFVSDDEDFHVKLYDGGAKGVGTTKFYIKLDATTNIGDNMYSQDFGPEGAHFKAGLNVNITKDGNASAGTGTVNIVYKDLKVAGA